ncbi:MAG: hypothetical protein KDF65_01055 [Anaerolineae bacterium]|nr:hypothetical protein [Anaerolineae bacterium]
MSHHEPKPVAEVDSDLSQQLTDLRRPPGPALRERIEAIPRRKTARAKLTARLAWSVAAVMMAGLLLASPPAQATLGVERWFGQIRLTVLDSYRQPSRPLIVESVPMSLAEAAALTGYTLTPPATLPPSLTGSAEVSVLKLAVPIARLRWRDSEGGFVQLSMLPANGRLESSRTLVGYDSSEAVQIGERPGVLVRGSWDAASQSWRYQAQMTTLIWEANGQQYKLLAFSDVISLAELVRMAESVE